MRVLQRPVLFKPGFRGRAAIGKSAPSLPKAYTLEDAQGRILEKDRHVLSLKT